MNIPSLNKNSNTKDGREKILKSISANCSGMKRRDLLCWNMYNNEHSESDYDYLRKVGDYEYPAHVRHIPKQRNKIDLLTSQQVRRPFTFSVYADDADTKGKKFHDISKAFLKVYTTNLKVRLYDNQLKLTQMDMQMSKMQEQLKQKPQNEEQTKKQEEIRQLLPTYTNRMELIKDEMRDEDILTERDIDKLKYHYRYEYKDYAEDLAQTVTKKLRQVHRIKQKSKRNFISQCTTGKQYYYVDYRNGDKLPTFESLNAMKVNYPNEDNVDFTHQSSWVAIEETKSPAQIIEENDWLNEDQVERINNLSDTYQNTNESGTFVATPGNGAVLSETISKSSSDVIGSGIRVVRVWWRAQKKIEAIQKPNKFEKGKYFTHFVNGKKVINIEDYTYDHIEKEYINNDNKGLRHKRGDVEVISSNKGEKFEKRYVDVRYKGIIINNDIMHSEIDPIQPRITDDFTFVPLPVIGRTFNDITEQPYSLIWATRELQNSYNIVHYHRELMLALSGVAGLVMDISQKPEGMSSEEWFYNMKMGRHLVQRTKKTGTVDRSFNQFPRVDMSISSSVQYLELMLEQIDNSIGDIMGVSRQRQGQVVSTDQVGTSEMAIQQSNLITEILYNEHDEVERQALEMNLQLACKYCLNNGALMDMSNFSSGTEFVKIPPGILGKINPVIHIANNTEEESSMQELKSLAMAQQKSGQLAFSDFINIYNTDTLKELEQKVKYFAEQADEMAGKRMVQEGQAEARNEQENIKLKGEIEAQIKKSSNEIDMYKAKLEEEKAKFDTQLEQRKLALEERKIKSDEKLKLLELINEDKSETGVLEENKRASTVNEKLKALELQLNALMSIEGLRQGDDEKDKKYELEGEKIKLESRKLNKEHVSDK